MILDDIHLDNARGGQAGTTFFGDTTSRDAGGSDYWIEITMITATVFTTLTMVNNDGTSIGATPFPAGFVLKGQFTTIKLASGSCWALRAGYAKIKTVP